MSKMTQFVTGDGRLLNVKEIADIYRNCVNLATPSSGKVQRLDDHNFSLTCRFSTTDCDTLESVKTSKNYSLKTTTRNNSKAERCIESVRCISDPQVVGETATVTSNNGRYLARLRGSTPSSSSSSPGGGGGGDKKQVLEIWNRSRLLKSFDLSEVDAHGPINTDPVFGSMSWYPFGEQDKLIYVCQKKRPKYQSFFKQTMPKTNDDKSEANDGPSKGKQLNLGDDNTREEDWGECLDGIEHTLVAVLDVGNNFKLTTVEVSGHSLAGVKWLNGMRSISVAYPEEPRRLGIIYCNNRPSHLVVHDWSQSPAVELFTMKSDTHCYHTARVDHSGQRFIYLMNPFYGPHVHSVRMHIHDLNTNQDQELVDKCTNEADMFVFDLLDNCFTSDGNHILFVKSDHLYNHLCLFDLKESKITKVKFPTTGLNLLDFKHDVILATGSEVNTTPTLYVAVLSPVNPGELVAWHQIEDCIHLDEIECKTYTIPTPDSPSFVSAILVSPCVDLLRKNFTGESGDHEKRVDNQLDLPTVVIVHGGPHHAFGVAYMPHLVFYSRLGLRSLLINYRGSTGVSEEYVKGLCGKVGELDVNDCLHAIRHFVSHKQINPNKLIIQGGSHGGFLSCHLSCQDEFKFTSAIIRNPVVDISTMHTTSDIPDWCYTEALGHSGFDFSWMPGSEELARMYKCSPISRFKEANVPTLMMLGTKDRRVKMFQGERWIELLEARGVKTQCKVYNDKHDLGRVEVSTDSSMSAALWILSNLK
uniref:acylaminoacyl-peptidase n=1 Tax=Aceria tosichella TaxID=561515 RepID=A0A6G1SAH6_9ACAR